MKFGELFSAVENHLISSYEKGIFESEIKTFKNLILQNEELSSIFHLYNQLNETKSLDRESAELLIQETIRQIDSLKSNTKKRLAELWVKNVKTKNIYKDIDNLIYTDISNLVETVQSKRKLISTLTETVKPKEKVNIPLTTLFKIANRTTAEYVQSLDEDTKKELSNILTEDAQVLENKYDKLKEETIEKLRQKLSENSGEVYDKIEQVLYQIDRESFDKINYVRLKSLSDNL